MTNAVLSRPTYEIQGYYFKDGGVVIPDSHFHHSDSDSMIDHQKAWYEEAKKAGYASGELDEIVTITSNYKGELNKGQLLAIVNDGELMDTPFGELFPKKIKTFVMNLLEAEYADLEAYVLENEAEIDCTTELDRMNGLKSEMADLAFHGR